MSSRIVNGGTSAVFLFIALLALSNEGSERIFFPFRDILEKAPERKNIALLTL